MARQKEEEMAQETQGRLNERTRTHVDKTLRALLADAEEMPEWVEWWENEEEFEYEQYVAESEWRNSVLAMKRLEELYNNGEMSGEQEQKYRKLKKLLKKRQDLIERLGLTPVGVPLD